jgi:hypothetical protein
MATVRRGRRRRRVALISGALRRYFNAILFILLGALIVGVISYVTLLVPEISIEVAGVEISNKLIISFIGWTGGILFVLTGIRRFGIRI